MFAATDVDFYPPVIITQEVLYNNQRPSSPFPLSSGLSQPQTPSTSSLPVIDSSLLLRPIVSNALLSPRHLHRLSANASPSVISWAGGEASHHHHNPHHHHLYQPGQPHTANFGVGLSLPSGPIRLSEPNMLATSSGSSSRRCSGGSGLLLPKRIDLNNSPGRLPRPPSLSTSSFHHAVDNVESFRKLSPAGSRATVTDVGNFSEARRELGQVWQQGRQRERQVDEQKASRDVDEAEEHFLDNPNIDELFLLGSMSQHDLVGKHSHNHHRTPGGRSSPSCCALGVSLTLLILPIDCICTSLLSSEDLLAVSLS